MNQTNKTFAVLFLCVFGASSARTEQAVSSTERVTHQQVSFYQVPLVCPAAPQIGCGSESKPLLLELERNPAVAEAWLNRAGTLLAVVWNEQSKPKARARTVETILKERGLTAKELAGKGKRRVLTEFESRKNWYRGADVDRLSEEEAGIIAHRWIGIFREKIVMSDEQVKALQEAFTTQIKRRLTGQITRQEAKENMVKIAHQYLDEKSIAVLMENFAGALRLGEEQ
jgi:hypothetical protein